LGQTLRCAQGDSISSDCDVFGRLRRVSLQLQMTKTELRTQMRRQLAALDAGTLRRHSAAVWERLAMLPEFALAAGIGAYVSTGTEIETHGLIRQLLAMGRSVGAPVFDGGRYRLGLIQDFDADLVVGEFGILEPRADAPVMMPVVWLVPGLAFDGNGNRLGRGRGFYDALLRGMPGLKIGLAHDFQLLDTVPVEAHDARVDVVVTETRVVYQKG
jgi:5-formyltetrahydrofolate cyclo-ligase